MENLKSKLQELVNDFLKDNVTEEKKHDFVIAAIHFNINLNDCTKYDLMRIDHKAKELATVEENDVLTQAAIYSYILFRAINRGEVPKEHVINVKMALLGVSTAITEYLTYRIGEEILNDRLYSELKELI